MKRGTIWTAAGVGAYAGKPRPVVIVQDDRFDATASITVVLVTTTSVDASFFRLPIEPTSANGLHVPSYLMADKVMTLPRARLRTRIGALAAADLRSLDAALAVFLGLAAGRVGS